MSLDLENRSQFSICLDPNEMQCLAAAKRFYEEAVGVAISRNKIIKKLLFEHPVFGSDIGDGLKGVMV